MDELFSPPGTAWTPVSPTLATLRRLMMAVAAALLAGAGVLLPLLLPLPGCVPVVLGLFVLLGAAVAWALIGRTHAVPYARVQSLRLGQGLWQRRLGLADVHVDSPPGPVKCARAIGTPPRLAACCSRWTTGRAVPAPSADPAFVRTGSALTRRLCAPEMC